MENTYTEIIERFLLTITSIENIKAVLVELQETAVEGEEDKTDIQILCLFLEDIKKATQ